MSNPKNCVTLLNSEISQRSLATTVQTQAEYLRDLIKAISAQRSFLLTRTNDEISATKDIPAEVLSIIFHLACQPPEFLSKLQGTPTNNIRTTFPSLLACVSSDWRDVVYDTPQLWTFMQAEVDDENVACVASRLLRYLHKSGALGVTVDLDFQKQMFTNCGRKARRMEKRQSQLHGLYYPDCEDIVVDQNDHEYLEPIRKVIFDENPEKFREIRLFNAPMEWCIDARTVFCAKFSLLEAIYFSWMYHYPQTEDAVHNFQFDFGALLNLKEVFIFGFPSKCIPAPHFIVSDTITVLHLSEIDYNTCVTVLLNLQRLRTISMMRPVTRNYHEDYIIQPNPIAGLTIQLPNLETFEWTFPDADSVWNYEVLKILPILYIPVHFGLGESRFEIEYQTSLTGLVEWKEEDKEGLRGLVEQSGLEVEVVEDGKRVEWL